MKTKTLISDAVVVNPTLPPRIFNPGWVVIEGDRISDIGEGSPPSMEVDRRFRAHGGMLLPGLVNTHNHAAMTLFRGLADDLPLKEWLEGTIFPAEAKAVDPEFVYWGTLLACLEMIKSGTTTFANGYFFEDEALDAVQKAGMRAVLTQGVIDFPTPDCPDPVDNVERAIAFVNRAKDEEPVRPGIFCHSAYTCSPKTLAKTKEACRVHGVPFFIHVSETRWEVEEITKRYGASPVRHLDGLGVLDENTVLVHGVRMDDGEIDLAAERGSGVSLCTESHMKLASGIAPFPKMRDKGVRLGLGTDGPASNNDLDMFGEMDLTAKLHKAATLDPTQADAARVLHIATQGGAKLLGWKELGRLEPECIADLILLKSGEPHLEPLYNPVSQLVYAARGADVDTVWIGGRTVMEGRKVLTLDEDEILSRCRKIAVRTASKS